MSIFKKTLLVSLALMIFASYSGLQQAHASALAPKTALLYGDSIMWESGGAIFSQFGTKRGWSYYAKAFPGIGACDWLSGLQNDLTTYNPSIVAIETEGNNGRPCMLDSNGQVLPIGSQAYLDKYTQDLGDLFSQITATGAKVLFVKAVPMKDTVWNTAINKLNAIGVTLAGQYHGVSVTSTPRNSVSASGQYVDFKTCLVAEVKLGYCGADGKITVRTTSGPQTGIHLCVSGLTSTFPFSCPDAYSSGEVRFGRSLVNAVVAPPKPILP